MFSVRPETQPRLLSVERAARAGTAEASFVLRRRPRSDTSRIGEQSNWNAPWIPALSFHPCQRLMCIRHRLILDAISGARGLSADETSPHSASPVLLPLPRFRTLFRGRDRETGHSASILLPGTTLTGHTDRREPFRSVDSTALCGPGPTDGWTFRQEGSPRSSPATG